MSFCGAAWWAAAKQHISKRPVPHASLLGLGFLAAQKRSEKEHQPCGNSADGKDSPVAGRGGAGEKASCFYGQGTDLSG
ncbi:UNVERIFIED_CONTAM: hypothetical protein K2H54_014394 [Gekko kuhli]